MASQLQSTRLFNENYFAFEQALEEVVRQGIKVIVLPGDFSDDGQPMNLLALREILQRYQQKHQLRFYLTTGNHDPVTVSASAAGKRDFLGASFAPSPMVSEPSLLDQWALDPSTTVINPEIGYGGYEDIIRILGPFGFYPSEQDLFWAHPFAPLDYEKYHYDSVLAQASLSERRYENAEGKLIPDLSYIVEPVEGLWLLAIDGNVYHSSSGEVLKSSSVGFNEAIIDKKHQLEWIEGVAKAAEEKGKTLISFSHFPLVEFNDGTDELLKRMFGPHKFQLSRSPVPETSASYAAAGLRVHVAGHMHLNDTGIFGQAPQNTLVNIQVPSLAAYPPAYKTMTFADNETIEVETHRLTEVQGMSTLFPYYQKEHQLLQTQNAPQLWNKAILEAKNYNEYTSMHLEELVRLRFIPSDWPKDISSTLVQLSGTELYFWARLKDSSQRTAFLKSPIMDQKSLRKLRKKMKKEGLSPSTFEAWNGQELITAFYFLKNGDELAQSDLDPEKYSAFHNLMLQVQKMTPSQEGDFERFMVDFAVTYLKMMDSAPSDHFLISPQQGTVMRLE